MHGHSDTDFDHLYGILELSKVAFYVSCRVETKSTKMLSLKLTTISSAYKFTRILNFSTL
jgi:hypothetical protein